MTWHELGCNIMTTISAMVTVFNFSPTKFYSCLNWSWTNRALTLTWHTCLLIAWDVLYNFERAQLEKVKSMECFTYWSWETCWHFCSAMKLSQFVNGRAIYGFQISTEQRCTVEATWIILHGGWLALAPLWSSRRSFWVRWSATHQSYLTCSKNCELWLLINDQNSKHARSHGRLYYLSLITHHSHQLHYV